MRWEREHVTKEYSSTGDESKTKTRKEKHQMNRLLFFPSVKMMGFQEEIFFFSPASFLFALSSTSTSFSVFAHFSLISLDIEFHLIRCYFMP
jgi:hypothetical protein